MIYKRFAVTGISTNQFSSKKMTFLQLAACVIFLAIGTSAYPNIFSHKNVGYHQLNSTVQPVQAGCTISSVSDVATATSSCTSINVGSFTVPAANQPLILQLKQGTTITFTGQIQFSKHAFSGYLIEIIGAGIKVVGSSTHKFNGHGELYWDGKGGAGSTKPTFMYLKGTGGSVFSGLSLLNCPARCVAIDGANNLKVTGFLIDNRAGAPGTAAKGKEGHNTDGFDVAKTQYLTLSNHVVYNQDDCVAINGGAHMVIDSLNCQGSHGFDIATGMSSDRSQNVVTNITFQNSKLYNSMYGLHLLAVNDGGKGSIDKIYYKNIQFSGTTDYGIMIQQDFSNSGQGSTGKPTGNVPITNVEYTGITGTMNGKYSYALEIVCASGACSNIKFNSVSITGAKSKNSCVGYKISGYC